MQNFVNKYFIECTQNSNIMPGAKEYMEILRKEGNEFILITARGFDLKQMKPEAQKILQKNNITFDKEYWAVQDKVKICMQEKIDIMIEDSIINIEKLAEAGIKTIYLKDSNMKSLNHPNIKECYIWGDIYRYISKLK